MAHTQQFWNSAISCIRATENHPFLMALLDGTLPMDQFQFYILQDSVYLVDYANALRRLATHDEASEEEKKMLTTFADSASQAELDLHSTFFKGWSGQIPDPSSVEACPNTLLYTSYIDKVIANRPHHEGLAVLLPCFWVYMHIGKRFVSLRGDSKGKRPTEYDQWLDMYGGDEFEKHVMYYINMVESAASKTDEEGRKMMQKHFKKGCELEWMFWYAALEKQAWPSINWC